MKNKPISHYECRKCRQWVDPIHDAECPNCGADLTQNYAIVRVVD